MTNRPSKFSGDHIQLTGHYELDFQFDQHLMAEKNFESFYAERLRGIEAMVDQNSQEILKNAKDEAKAILLNAKQRAQMMIEDAEDRVEELEKTAYTKGESAGFDKGYQDGMELANRDGAQVLDSCQVILQGVQQARAHAIESHQQFLSETIRLCLEKLAGPMKHWPNDDHQPYWQALIENTLRQVLLTIKEAPLTQFQVLCSAQLLESLDLSGELKLQVADLSAMQWLVDPNLKGNELFLLGEKRQWNLSLDRQLDTLSEALTAHMPPLEID